MTSCALCELPIVGPSCDHHDPQTCTWETAEWCRCTDKLCRRCCPLDHSHVVPYSINGRAV